MIVVDDVKVRNRWNYSKIRGKCTSILVCILDQRPRRAAWDLRRRAQRGGKSVEEDQKAREVDALVWWIPTAFDGLPLSFDGWKWMRSSSWARGQRYLLLAMAGRARVGAWKQVWTILVGIFRAGGVSSVDVCVFAMWLRRESRRPPAGFFWNYFPVDASTSVPWLPALWWSEAQVCSNHRRRWWYLKGRDGGMGGIFMLSIGRNALPVTVV